MALYGITAGEDLTGKEGLIIERRVGDDKAYVATSNSPIFGVLVTGGAADTIVSVRTSGPEGATTGGTFNAGQFIGSDDVGKAISIPAGSSAFTLGVAEESSTAAGQTKEVMINPIGALPIAHPVDANGIPLSTPSGPLTSVGAQRIQVDLREGTKLEIISQNFCDKRTWFTDSTRRNAVTLEDTGDGLTWQIPAGSGGDAIGVDVTHGRISDESEIEATYAPVVRVDAVTMNEHSADSTFTYDGSGNEVHDFSSGDADFGIDYTTMKVTFATSQAGKTVDIDFSEVGGSKWYMDAAAGKCVLLEAAELQFSSDARMKSDFIFQARGQVDLHPLLQPYWDGYSPPGPYPAGTMLPLGDPTKYKNKMDLINQANISHPVIPKDTGALTWRDLPQDIQIYRWDYKEQAVIMINGDWGMDIEISLGDDIEAGGSYAVVTFYGIVEDVT